MCVRVVILITKNYQKLASFVVICATHLSLSLYYSLSIYVLSLSLSLSLSRCALHISAIWNAGTARKYTCKHTPPLLHLSLSLPCSLVQRNALSRMQQAQCRRKRDGRTDRYYEGIMEREGE
jgi:hypothetical protein